MRITLLCVGRPGRLLSRPVSEYEARAGRYFDFRAIEVKAGRGEPEQVRDEEAEALLARLPERHRVFALTRGGDRMGTRELAEALEDLATYGPGAAAWLVGGAFGLGSAALERADQRVSISDLTMPHELARLVLAEQLYRVGTILRGEPYHKGT